MAQIPQRQLRLREFASSDLDLTAGARGEIYYDGSSNSLRIFDSLQAGGYKIARADLSNVTGADFIATATAAGLANNELTNVSNSKFIDKSVAAKLATVVYTVTIQGPEGGDVGNKYVLNGVYRPLPNFVVGYTYVFVQNDPTNVYFPNANGTTANRHPLNFSADNLSGERGGGTSYLDNVVYLLNGLAVSQAVYTSIAFVNATSRQVRITITNNTPATLYYWCYLHTAMGNSISVADPGSGQILDTISNLVGLSFASGVGVNEFSNDPTFTDNSNSSVPTEQAVRSYIDRRLGIDHNGGFLPGNQLIGSAPFATESYADNLLANITFTNNTIDSIDSSAIVFTPSVQFDSDITVGTEIVFSDGTRQSSSAQGIPGPQGAQGPAGASGAGTGDVLSAGGSYVDNAIVRYDGVTGTIIQVSAATITDAGLLSATNFSGGGASLTALNATQLTSGTVPDARFPATLPATSGVNLTALNATNLGSGTVPNARFPATLPATSGVNLTALNATQLTSGTVPVLRLGDSGTRDGTTYLRGDNVWATVAGGASSNSFATVAVSGQSNVVAASATDTLTLVAGSNITITTDAGTDTVTIASASGVTTLDGLSDVVITSASNGQVLKYNGSNWINDTDATAGAGSSDSFATIAVAGQSSVIADSSTDTLTLAAGSGITITTNAGTDTVTITNSASAGATTFAALTDNAGLTADRFYLPAITQLAVTASGSSAYLFDQYAGNNPTIYAISGTTIAFDLSVGLGSHPFLIRFSGANYSTGLVHVTTSGTVTTGSAAQGKTSGTLYWKIPAGISGTYGYLCSNHGTMVGTITVKDISAI